MRPFSYERVGLVGEAVRLDARPALDTDGAPQYLAGGTNLIDLMKIDVLRPQRLIDISELAAQYGSIEADADGLRLGALARMSQAADHPLLRRDYPVIAQSLELAASAQLRNMATLAGNVLQRTRCHYFRDVSYPCNKRAPGSGCAAIGGVTRMLAVLGTSAHCIASYAGDFAQALIALDAEVHIIGSEGMRRLPFAQLHRPPGDTPHVENTLQPGELITAFSVPARPWTRRSLYLKVRDRASYAFALASAAVALDIDHGSVREARIALGGVASKPWRAYAAEQALRGGALDEAAATRAADIAFADARTQHDNAFKPELGRRTLVTALLQAATLELS
jgi:xanthine dehydrogenase YagS FAD-binding subunit